MPISSPRASPAVDVPHEARELAPEAIISKTDPLLDCLRNEPRFQAIERELRFPN